MSIIIRYSEIALKGKNRINFEQKLVKNIKECLKKNNVEFETTKKVWGRIVIDTKATVKKAMCLKNVFGISSFSVCTRVEPSIDKIKKASQEFISDLNKEKKFRVTAKRIQSNSKFNSMDIQVQLGDFVRKKTNASVNLTEYDLNINVELIRDNAYIFTDKDTIQGYSGLPLGIEGRVCCIIDDDKSVLAAFLAMKRGCYILPILFNTTEKSISLIEKFSYGQEIKPAQVKDIKNIKQIIDKNPCLAVVTGQTLENLEEIPIQLPVLRPLIGYDDKEIKEMFKKIK